MKLLLLEVPTRPLYAHVATSNGASLRVLQKCGFVIEQVRENEKLYRQLELTVRKTTKMRDGDAEGPLTLVEFKTVDTVVQDDLVYCRVTASSNTSAGAPPARSSGGGEERAVGARPGDSIDLSHLTVDQGPNERVVRGSIQVEDLEVVAGGVVVVVNEHLVRQAEVRGA